MRSDPKHTPLFRGTRPGWRLRTPAAPVSFPGGSRLAGVVGVEKVPIGARGVRTGEGRHGLDILPGR